MSPPKFDVQGSPFESLGSIAAKLFDQKDKYKLFATKVWPVLVRYRQELAECYDPGEERPWIEPAVLLGVLIFQFLERVPDRQASELVKYHLAWKPALNLKLGPSGFHPATFVYFRHWLSKAAKNEVALRAVVAALQEKGFTPKRSKERLELQHVLVAVARLSALERACETLALALEELDRKLKEGGRPEFWGLLWERYVESKLDYKSGEEGLESKIRQARADYLYLLQWLEPLGTEIHEGKPVALLREVFAQHMK